MTEEFEKAMEHIGNFGKYQKMMTFFICMTFTPLGFFMFAAVFIYDSPPHRCRIPIVDEVNNRTADVETLQLYIPPPTYEMDGKDFSQCTRYVHTSGNSPLERGDNTSLLRHENCKDGWVYNNENRVSAVNEFDLVCANAWKKPLLTSALMVGMLIGSFVSGPLTDRFGRRTLGLTSIYVGGLLILAISFSPVYEVLLTSVVINGIVHVLQYCSMFVLAQELVDTSHRAIVSCSVNVSFAIGYMLLAPVAYFVTDWRWILRCLSLANLVFIPYFFFLPESPRWLMSGGKFQDAVKVMKTMGRVNKADKKFLEDLGSNNFTLKKKEENPARNRKGRRSSSLHILATNPIMRNRSLVLFCVWNVSFTCYYVFGYNTSNLGGNNYVNCFVAAALDIPCSFFVAFSIQKFGRRNSLSSYFFLAGICCICSPLLRFAEAATITFATIGKFFATSTMSILFLYTSELYPTLLRNTGVGLSSMSSRFSTMAAPFLVFAGETAGQNIPFYVMAALALTTALISLLLPETRQSSLPDTLLDAVRLEEHRLSITSVRKSIRRKESEEPLASKTSRSDFTHTAEPDCVA